MKKEEIVFIVGIIRKTVQEKRKMNTIDAKLIVEKLELCNKDNIEDMKNIVDAYILNKVYYFQRKNNKLKIEEYSKIRKRNIAFFEFFLNNKSYFIPKVQ